ncbi:MAG: sulfatase [Deltaproteobacteria bacterium]|nr:sulfatase [Deltaproteobacteria bacterium]MBW2363454.1 sulfatase [Deltaproteobacteria bacterium]
MRHATLLLASLLAACGAPAPDDGLPPQRRHVLLLTVDTLRADHLGANGYPLDTTPFLDELLAQGVNFTGAIAPVPRTTPTLASLLTGAYPHTTQVRGLTDTLSENVTTLAERLLEQGFRTVAVVSNHMLTPERELDRGFEVYDFGDDARGAAATTDAALARADVLASEARVFLWVHYIDPHVPYYPPPDLARAFDPEYSGRYALHFGSRPGGIGAQAYPEDLPKAEAVYGNRLPDAVNAHVRRLYAADIRNTDDQIRRLVHGLRARLGPDWLITFTADHGESLGEHDYFYDHGEYVYNAGLRVPLAIVPAAGDPLAGAGRVDAWVSLVDVAPTLAELLCLPGHADWQLQLEGRSLVPYLRGETPPAAPVFAISGHSYFPHLVRRRVRFDPTGRFRAVIEGRHKLIWTPGAAPGQRFELYDLVDDPEERSDLSDREPQRRAALQRRLNAWMRGAGGRARTPNAEDRERLRQLGYVE